MPSTPPNMAGWGWMGPTAGVMSRANSRMERKRLLAEAYTRSGCSSGVPRVASIFSAYAIGFS